MVTEAQVRRIALALPGAYEHPSHGGRPSWRTKTDRHRAESLITESWKLRAPATLRKRAERESPKRNSPRVTRKKRVKAPRRRGKGGAAKTTFVLIPGAGGASVWYWQRVVPLLEKAGHEALAVDLPSDDERSGLRAYAQLVLAAIGKRRDITLVAQSLGGFTAAIVCALAPKRIRRLVFVNAMIPLPGETAGEWWDNTGSEKARKAAARRAGYGAQFDLTYFFHDVPKRIEREAAAHEREESAIAFREPARFESWPDVPIHVVVGKDDRFFPRDFQARVARERLGVTVDEVPGGHLVALSRPRELAKRLLGYVAS